MNLYFIEQSAVAGYDTYDSAVVAAESVEQAKTIYPGYWDKTCPEKQFLPLLKNDWNLYDWTSDPNDVTVTYLGVAVDDSYVGVILASFNAG